MYFLNIVSQPGGISPGKEDKMTEERNRLYETLRKWHVPGKLAYRIVVRAVA